MNALYKSGHGAGTVSLQERPMPVPNELDNVLIRVEACAVCGMDAHMFHDRFPCTPPFIMGHEFVGIVQQVLDNVTTLKPGDRVIAQPHLYSCGTCDACKQGLTQLCKDKRSIGINRDGAMASHVVVPEQYLHVVPESIPAKLACILEPFSMVYGNFAIPIQQLHAETAVVIGAGQVGLLGVVAAKSCGVKNLLLSGVTHDFEFRFPTALKLGADMVVDSRSEDVVQRVLALTEGLGADIVLEASGSESGINAAIAMVKPGGRIVVMGGTKRDTTAVTWDACLKKAIRLQFHMMSNYAYMDQAIQAFANPYTDLSPLITKECSLSNWQEAFDAASSGQGIKNVIHMEAT